MVYVVSYSGGKDSTALILFMIEKGVFPDEIVFCDTGVEYPEIYENVEKMKQICKEYEIDFTTLKSDFWELLHHHKYTKHRFPIFNGRWCTALMKRDKVNSYLRKTYGLHNYYNICGIAYDEKHRCKKSKYFIYPLVNMKITEKQCLEKYIEYGFNETIYKRFTRTGCYCCPFKNKRDIAMTIKYYPELWDKIKQEEKQATTKWKDKGCEYWERRCKNEIQ